MVLAASLPADGVAHIEHEQVSEEGPLALSSFGAYETHKVQLRPGAKHWKHCQSDEENVPSWNQDAPCRSQVFLGLNDELGKSHGVIGRLLVCILRVKLLLHFRRGFIQLRLIVEDVESCQRDCKKVVKGKTCSYNHNNSCEE